MLKQRELRDLGFCRRCLNGAFGVHLRHRDVLYREEPGVCRRCGQVHNIVRGIRLFSRHKVFGLRMRDLK